jgi:transposase
MAGLNKYYRRSKISEARFRHLLRCFALDLTASETAVLTGLSRRSANDVFGRLRERISRQCRLEASQAPKAEAGHGARREVEIDESYFGPRRVRGRPGRGALGKTIVFGIYERGGRIHTEIVADCSKKTLQAVIRGRVPLETVIHSDGWSGYDGLVDVGYAKHLRLKHRDPQFASGASHINGIESFWSFAKRRLAQFNGLRSTHFELHLKECQWRFNHRHEDLYRLLLKLLREHPL